MVGEREVVSAAHRSSVEQSTDSEAAPARSNRSRWIGLILAPILALQRKVTSYTGPYLGDFDAPLS